MICNDPELQKWFFLNQFIGANKQQCLLITKYQANMIRLTDVYQDDVLFLSLIVQSVLFSFMSVSYFCIQNLSNDANETTNLDPFVYILFSDKHFGGAFPPGNS